MYIHSNIHPQGIHFGLQVLNNNYNNKHTLNKTNRTSSYNLTHTSYYGLSHTQATSSALISTHKFKTWVSDSGGRRRGLNTQEYDHCAIASQSENGSIVHAADDRQRMFGCGILEDNIYVISRKLSELSPLEWGTGHYG